MAANVKKDVEQPYRAQIDLGLQFLTKNSATEFMITNLFIGLSYSFFTLFVDEKKHFKFGWKMKTFALKIISNHNSLERGGN